MRGLYLLFILLFLANTAYASKTVEREGLSDSQLLEVLVQGTDRDADPQAGVATLYASRFIGRRTTSGERYHPEKLTAAHALLPLGTLVTVENLATGQKVPVLINDRCRKRSFQLIDLSRFAAQQIGLNGMGALKVRIVPIEKKHPLDELLAEAKE